MTTSFEAGARQDLTDVRFEIGPDVAGKEVSVVGDFNDWDPYRHPMSYDAERGVMTCTVTIPAGARVEYRYLASGDQWFDDPEADEYVGNPVGGTNSVIHVPLPPDGREADRPAEVGGGKEKGSPDPAEDVTLTEVLAGYQADGYEVAYRVDEQAGAILGDGPVQPDELMVVSLRRLEGASDPGDMVAVAAVAWLDGSDRGTLVLRYGPEASELEAYLFQHWNDGRGTADVPSATPSTEAGAAGSGAD